MTYLVVANAEAGGAADQAVGAALSVLRASGPTELVTTSGPDDLDDVVTGVDTATLVVAGGDGSVHAVVERLWRHGRLDGVTVGLVPLGTGNDLARGLGLPLDPVEAAQVVVSGRPRRLDLLTHDGDGVVVNAAHAGLGAEAAARADSLKGRLGPLAYPLGALIAGVREQGWRLEVTVDGTRLEAGDRLLMVGVANGGSIGGGTRLAPPADPGDGLLDVVAVVDAGRPARAAFAAALRKGRHLDRDGVRHVAGREVTIEGEAVRHNVDGELSDELARRAYTVVPGAWTLIAPER